MTHRIISAKIFWLILLLLPALINAQNIKSIEIDGAKVFPDSQYLRWINISTGAKYFDGISDSISERIDRGLITQGYYHYTLSSIHVDSSDTSNISIVISLIEGKPTIINKIEFEGIKTDSLFVVEIFDDLKGSLFTKVNMEESFNQILDHFENNGFPFLKVIVRSVYFYNDSTSNNNFADVLLSIQPNEKSVVDQIEIEGNTKTKDYVITRAAEISVGDLYDQKQIDEIPEKLNRLRFFEPVEEPSYYFNSKNQGTLKIKIKEKQTNNFDGIFGYVPSTNNNEKGYFTGYINISLRNLFGTERAAAIRWLQENRNSQELELKYLEPWIFNFPFNIQGSLYQRKQDTTYVQRTVEGSFEYIATQDISASIIVSSQSTIPTVRNVPVFTVYNSTSFTSGINLNIDTRDDPYSPTKGIVLLNTYKFTSKEIDGPAEYITDDTKTKTNFQRLELDFSFFKELFRDQVGMIGVHARELRGSNVEVSDLYFLGGTNSLRGYREKQFQGNRILWSNLEYRYLLTRRTFAFVFLDTGYYLRNANPSYNIDQISDFKIGYGFGMNLETGLGVLGISFALGKGDSFSEGKIHFGIINEF